MVQSSCAREKLGVKLTKTVLIPFTKRLRYELKTSTSKHALPTFFKYVIYLETIIDQCLSNVIYKATIATWINLSIFGKLGI